MELERAEEVEGSEPRGCVGSRRWEKLLLCKRGECRLAKWPMSREP